MSCGSSFLSLLGDYMLLDFGTVLFYVAVFFGLYTTIFFFLTVYENWGGHKTVPKRTNLPSVCVIVPCFNEEKSLARTLNSLLALDYPKKLLEIIVVDDGSVDKTYAIACSYEKKGVVVYKKKNGGKHTALNLALKKTNAEFVGALDADSTVAPDSLRKLTARFDDPEVMAVTPSMIIDNPHGLLRRIQSIEFLIGIFLRRVFADLGSQNVTPGPFTIFRRTFFERYGYYREAHKTEDIELALRIQSNNFHIENATDAYVYTHGPGTWKGLYNQRLRWYHGFISNVLDYRHLFGPKHGNLGMFILPVSFISLAMLSAVIFYTVFKALFDTIQYIYNYWLIGFDFWKMFEWHFDSFFINTSPLVILGAFTLFTSIMMIYIAKRYAKQKSIIYSYILFMIFYSWIYVFWWIAAVLHKIFGKKVAWGHKSIVGG